MKRGHAVLAFLFPLLCSVTALAQEEPASAYPSRTIRIIVPYAGGGGTDLLARTWAEVLRKELGQPVIVESRPGGNGIIGTSFVAKAPPDGYTLYIATYGFPVTPLLVKDAQYAVKDFAPIIRTGTTPLALVVAPDSPIKSVADLVGAARAKPGSLNTGTLGDGSQEQMGSQKFQSIAGVKFTEIPYKGAVPAITDLLGGSIQLMFEGLPTVLSFIKSGRLRALGVTGTQRSSQLPDVPTIDEQGVKGVDVFAWTGFLAPAKTPRPIIDKLNAAFRKGLADPAVVSKIAQSFGSESAGGTPEDFAAFIEARTRENAALISAMGIKPQ
ncbi:MAG TPA: tripartite tricarboxylate transporter substrate binding protein [Acidobacteriaceae bacterium]|nr:tripartite tricarboxylate transporter substrate binding protein [Acidobacteriaceae bacterium]